MSQDERRCPNCDALVTVDADWCGQCFADLREPPPPPPPPPLSAPSTVPRPPASEVAAEEETGITVEAKADPFWPCPVCGARNPIFFEACETCGTPFATIMRGVTRRDVDPQTALRRSLLFPGAGHAMLGHPIDGFARGVLFVLSLGLALFLLVAGLHSGPMLLAILLSLGLATGVYVLSALEIKELASRGHLIVASRFLLWASAGVVFLIVGMIAASIATSGRR